MEWNLEAKHSTTIVDNCILNDGMINALVEKLFGDLLPNGRVLHMRCCAHICILVVKDGLVADDSITY